MYGCRRGCSNGRQLLVCALPPLSLALDPLPPCPQSRQLMSLKLEQGRVTLDQRAVTRSSGGLSGGARGAVLFSIRGQICFRG